MNDDNKIDINNDEQRLELLKNNPADYLEQLKAHFGIEHTDGVEHSDYEKFRLMSAVYTSDTRRVATSLAEMAQQMNDHVEDRDGKFNDEQHKHPLKEVDHG